MNTLQRQQLVWLEAAAWPGVVARWSSDATDSAALACLRHWAASDLPLVVTRQPASPTTRSADDAIALGLPAPEQWQRRRIQVAATRDEIHRVEAFPRAAEVVEILPLPVRADWRLFCTSLRELHVTARVYGSYGWQRLTGLDYVHPQSDIDLLLELATFEQAARASALLSSLPDCLPCVDGEFLFPDAAAIPWREWSAWHGGNVKQVLVKRQCGVSLERLPRDVIAA